MCRRCSECEHQDHHWTENPLMGMEPLEIMAEGEATTQQEAELVSVSEYCCKHCDALAMICSRCDGNGDLEHLEDEEDFDEDDEGCSCDYACPDCHGEEIIITREESNGDGEPIKS